MDIIENLNKYKRSDVAVLFGSGSSIGSLTPADWDALKRYDTWTLNDFVYHNFIFPRFYFLQPKWYDFRLLKSEFEKKKKYYKETIFLYHRDKQIDVEGQVRYPQEVVGEENIKIGFVLRKRRPLDANYEFDEDALTCTHNASISFCIETIFRLEYESLVLYGVDLHDSKYFWSDPKKYPNVHHRTNKEHEPDEPHRTYRIKDFIFDFNARRFRGQMFVGHKDTALYPELNYLDLLDGQGT